MPSLTAPPRYFLSMRLLKSAALLPMREAALTNTEHIEDAVDIDEKREFQIISEENEDGQLLLSIRRIEYRLAWEKIVAVLYGARRW